jgi:hypothetical protein
VCWITVIANTSILYTASGKIPWRERTIGTILEKSVAGDVIVVAEVSRLGRSTLQVLEMLEMAAQKNISVRIAKISGRHKTFDALNYSNT